MNIDDLTHIFRPQIQQGTKKLHYMLIEDLHVKIQHHPVDRLEELIPVLKNFQFEGYKPGHIARFVK